MVNTAAPILLSALDSKQKRDLYLELMREIVNPAQAYLTKNEVTKDPITESDIDALFVIKGRKRNAAMSKTATDATAAPAAPAARRHSCHTQHTSTTGGVNELFLGNDQGTLFLWETGSKINWIARKDGYPGGTDDAIFAARACYTAAAAWNKALKGRAEFVYVDDPADACFELVYHELDPENPGIYASAFFPDDYMNVLNQVYIYPYSFEERVEAPYTFAHELGHVLGLRHEHSQEPNQQAEFAEDGTQVDTFGNELGTTESILFGIRNPWSVMAYYDQCTIQPSDVKTLNKAYDTLKDGEMVAGTALVGTFVWDEEAGKPVNDKRRKVTVEKKIYRVAPDN